MFGKTTSPYYVRATPTVGHPKLPLLFFFGKNRKTFSNSSPSQVVIYPKLGKTDSACAYMRAAIHTHPPVLEEVEGYKNNFVFLRIPDLSFQDVEGYKHN
jgi:hypothetical protein